MKIILTSQSDLARMVRAKREAKMLALSIRIAQMEREAQYENSLSSPWTIGLASVIMGAAPVALLGMFFI